MADDDNEGLPGMVTALEITDPNQASLFENIPLRAAQVGALLASGFNAAEIDKAFSLPIGTARSYKSQYFTKRNVTLSPGIRDRIVAGFLRTKALDILVAGTTPAKLDKVGTGEASKSASAILTVAARLEGQAETIDTGKRISDALSRLSGINVPAKQINTTNNS